MQRGFWEFVNKKISPADCRLEKKTCCKDNKFYRTKIRKSYIFQVCVKKCQCQNGNTGRANQSNNSRTQSGENFLYSGKGAVFIVKVSQRQADNKGRDNAPKCA